MENETKVGGSVVSRILCKELLILLVGLFILGSGFYTGEAMQYFWGGTIVIGAVALYFVRKKDWKQHWEEQERLALALEERRRRQKEEGK
jgi:hypothetical protein